MQTINADRDLTATLFGPSLGKHPTAHGGTVRTGSFADFCALIETASRQPPCPKLQGGFWTAASLENGRRTNATARSLDLFALDHDAGQTWDQLQTWLDSQSMAYCLYETPSSSPARSKWRCILPLAHRVDLGAQGEGCDDWRASYLRLMHRFEEIAGVEFDGALGTPSQPVFFPTRLTDASPLRRVLSSPLGKPYDHKAALASLPAPAPKAKPVTAPAPTSFSAFFGSPSAAADAGAWLRTHPCPASGQGMRHKWLLRAACTLAGFGLDFETSMAKLASHGIPAGEVGDAIRWAASRTPRPATAPVESAAPAPAPDTEIDDLCQDIAREAQEARDTKHPLETYLRPFRDRADDRKRDAERRADPSLGMVALAIDKAAHKLVPEFAKHYKSLGRNAPLPRCRTRHDALVEVDTADSAVVSRHCNNPSCGVCGPRRLAHMAEAVVSMPLASKQGAFVGAPLGDRTVYQYELPVNEVENLAAHHNRMGKMVDLRQGAPDNGNSLKSTKSSGTPDDNNEISERSGGLLGEAQGYAMFVPEHAKKVNVLSTCPVTVKTAKLIGTFNSDPEALRAEVIRLLKLTYGTYTPSRGLRTAQSLRVDIDHLHRLAFPGRWVVEKSKTCSPKEAGLRLRAEGLRATTVESADKKVLSTHVAPEPAMLVESNRIRILQNLSEDGAIVHAPDPESDARLDQLLPDLLDGVAELDARRRSSVEFDNSFGG